MSEHEPMASEYNDLLQRLRQPNILHNRQTRDLLAEAARVIEAQEAGLRAAVVYVRTSVGDMTAAHVASIIRTPTQEPVNE